MAVVQTVKKNSLKRPPFDFAIPSYLEHSINSLADAIESEVRNWGHIAVLESQVMADSRGLQENSPEEAWIINYYCNRVWMNDFFD
jgi:hypothetical protein